MDLLPTSVAELSQLSVFKLWEILRYHNVLDCGTKDELALRATMVISGKARLAFRREYFAIKNLITAVRTLIQLQKRMYVLDPKVIIKTRCFSTPSSPSISTTRPRDRASVFSKKTRAFVPIPAGTSIETLDDILQPFSSELDLYAGDVISDIDIREGHEVLGTATLQAIRSVGANVLAKWSKEEIGDTGWKAGLNINFSILSVLYQNNN